MSPPKEHEHGSGARWRLKPTSGRPPPKLQSPPRAPSNAAIAAPVNYNDAHLSTGYPQSPGWCKGDGYLPPDQKSVAGTFVLQTARTLDRGALCL